jgi:hypothetical protein
MSRYPRISSISVQPEYTILLLYANGEKRIFDVKPYLDIGIFKELRDSSVFRSVHISFDTIAWSNGADIEPEELYADSVPA